MITFLIVKQLTAVDSIVRALVMITRLCAGPISRWRRYPERGQTVTNCKDNLVLLQ